MQKFNVALYIINNHNDMCLCASIYLRGVVGQIQEETHVLHRPILFKVLFEEASGLHVYLQ